MNISLLIEIKRITLKFILFLIFSNYFFLLLCDESNGKSPFRYSKGRSHMLRSVDARTSLILCGTCSRLSSKLKPTRPEFVKLCSLQTGFVLSTGFPFFFLRRSFRISLPRQFFPRPTGSFRIIFLTDTESRNSSLYKGYRREAGVQEQKVYFQQKLRNQVYSSNLSEFPVLEAGYMISDRPGPLLRDQQLSASTVNSLLA